MLRNIFRFGFFASTVVASPFLHPRQGTNAAKTGASNTACALVAKASAQFLKENPDYNPEVSVKLAVDCLDSIPIIKDNALNLVRSLKLYLEFQSDKEYLKNPPAGFSNPAFDLDLAFNQIQKNVEHNAYSSETEFQKDVFYALSAPFDGHTFQNPDILTGLFSFSLNFTGLTSISKDGIEDPKIYFTKDVFVFDKDTKLFKATNNPSALAVTKIDGVDATEYVEINSLLTKSQDPDTRYQRQFFSIAAPATRGPWGNFIMSRIAPSKDTMTFTFADGSTKDIAWTAVVKQNFNGITNGLTAYQKFVPFATRSAVTAATAPATSISASSSSSATATNAAATTVPFFPKPVIKSRDNTIAGYYLTTAGFTDVAVLQILSFSPKIKLEEISGVVAKFLAAAKAAGKTKLIIDVQQNGGGIIDLGTDIVQQIFPNLKPNTSANMRRSIGLDIIVSSASTEVNALAFNQTAANFEAMDNAPFSYQYDINPDGTNINSIDELLNRGIEYSNTKFTSFFQTNFSDPLASQATGFSITQTDTSLKPPFAPENIVVLTDGVCASTCAVFSEHLKNKGSVQQIMVGGRPKHGPVQAVGGVKGSQLFNGYTLDYMVDIFYNATDAELASVKDTPWAFFDSYPLLRSSDAAIARKPAGGLAGAGVNGRNAFRLGDTTNTPLQYVFDAADCRIWWTPELAVNAMALWTRVSQVAFKDRSGLKYTSKYCVAGSTGHPTAVSGGWQRGTLGDQSQGKIEAASPIFKKAPWNIGSKVAFHWDKVADASSFGQSCQGYAGDNWGVKFLCQAYTSGKSS